MLSYYFDSIIGERFFFNFVVSFSSINILPIAAALKLDFQLASNAFSWVMINLKVTYRPCSFLSKNSFLTRYLLFKCESSLYDLILSFNKKRFIENCLSYGPEFKIFNLDYGFCQSFFRGRCVVYVALRTGLILSVWLRFAGGLLDVPWFLLVPQCRMTNIRHNEFCRGSGSNGIVSCGDFKNLVNFLLCGVYRFDVVSLLDSAIYVSC